MVTECCSESRIRSRTSRGVPKWSEGKELYIGSAISTIGTSFGVTGIVPGPPEGSRGPPGGATYPEGHMGCRGCALAYMGQGHQPQEAHAPRDKERKSPKGGRHLRGALGRMDSPPPLGRRTRCHLEVGRRPLGWETLKGAQPWPFLQGRVRPGRSPSSPRHLGGAFPL